MYSLFDAFYKLFCSVLTAHETIYELVLLLKSEERGFPNECYYNTFI